MMYVRLRIIVDVDVTLTSLDHRWVIVANYSMTLRECLETQYAFNVDCGQITTSRAGAKTPQLGNLTYYKVIIARREASMALRTYYIWLLKNT